MTKILVTGGAGFIGYHLVKELSRTPEHEIHVVDNLSRGRMDAELKELIERPKMNFIQGDLTDPGFYTGLDTDYDIIYHLAAFIGVKNVINNPDRVLNVNSRSILNILEWLKDNNKDLKKFLFSSTSEVYAGTLKHYGIPVPTDENVNLALDDIRSFRTTYALSKLLGESACFSYNQKYKIPITIVRYHNIYGPRMGFVHVIPELLIRANSAKEEFEVYSPKHTRAFCYVDDGVQFTIRLAESAEAAGHIVHVGNSEEEISMEQLAGYIIELINPALKIKPLADQEGSPARRCPDTTKLQSFVNQKPKIALKEGIKFTWDWYRDHLDERFE